jgi:serine/threonine-protein kinase HipA
MQWARGSGFDVPRCEVRDAADLDGIPARVHGRTVFVIQRFDREAGRRVHQEDLAQVLGIDSEDAVTSTVSFGYAEICRVVGRILGEDGVREFVRRLAFIVASGNEDAHLKNWAFLYPDGVAPAWAPLYDQVATIAWSGGSEGVTLDLGGVRAWEAIDQSALDRFANVASMRPNETTEVFDATVLRLRDAWRELECAAAFDPMHAAAIRNHWIRVPLLARHGPLDV